MLVLAAALAFGRAWWVVWKNKKSEKRWGIVASLLSILVPLPMLHFGWSTFLEEFLGFYWPTAVFGLCGLIAFSRYSVQISATTTK